MPSKKIADIKVSARQRKEMGDIAGLAHSIDEVGLLQPVAVTPDGKLIAGARRLAAVKRLGRKDIETVVVNGLDDALTALKAERDENVQRLAFTPSEAVALGNRLEELERKAAKQRQGRRTDLQHRGKLPPSSNGKTRDKVGEAVGLSGRTYEKAKRIVEAAERDPETYLPMRETMDRTGNIDRTFKWLKRTQQRDERAAQAEKIEGDFGIHARDFRKAGRAIANGTVDLIFTDLPYGAKYLPLYGDLSAFAERVLKPGGLCLSYSGRHALPRELGLLGSHLTYLWEFAVRHQHGAAIMRAYNMRIGWKPILAFYKPPLQAWWELFADITSGGREKGDHEWQQAVSEAAHFIKALCPPGGLVCDPFAGSGTTLIAARSLGMKYVGFEIDHDTASIARARLAEAEEMEAVGGMSRVTP